METYQAKYSQGCCFPGIHTPKFDVCLRCNNQSIERDFDVLYLRSYLSRLRIPEFPELILQTVI